MNTLTRFLRAEPAAITAAVAATLGVLVMAGIIDDAAAGALLAAVGAWLVVVRQMVTPTVKLPKPDDT